MISKNLSKDILSKLKISDEDIVFLAGSIIEGIGNEYSDMDVYVIRMNDDEVHKSVHDFDKLYYQVSFFRSDSGINCDVEYWDYRFVDDLFSKIGQIDFNDESVYTVNLVLSLGGDINDIKSLIHRMNNSVCIQNFDEYKKIMKKLEAVKPNFSRLMIRYFMNCADSIYYDIIGNLNKNLSVAKISANDHLIHIMYSYIFSMGNTIDRFKWIPKILEKIDKDVSEKFDRIYCNSGGLSIEENIKESIKFCKRIASEIEERGSGI